MCLADSGKQSSAQIEKRRRLESPTKEQHMTVVKSVNQEVSAEDLRQKQIDQYWAGDLARRVYLFRRQRKAILENCRRIAVVGASS